MKQVTAQTFDNLEIVDRSNEQTIIQDVPPGPFCWTASDIDQSQWGVELTPTAIAEVDSVAEYIAENPVQLLQRRESEIDWPNTRECLKDLRSRLLNGPGFSVLLGLDPDRYGDDVSVELFWLLGQCIGQPVAQKWNGQMIYDVRDTGQTYGYGVRGSTTSVELVFHIDNAFGIAVPDYVGLYCSQPAKTGGISRFCSLYTVHERMREADLRGLQRLYQPMLFDRQKEHNDGAPQVLFAPFFSWRNNRLFARANTSLVRKGYAVAGVSIDEELENALQAVEQICEQPDLWYEAPLQRGHIQYLNNHEIGHYRSAFEDHDEPSRKRHLYRLWHRDSGSVAYDGM